jgi:hypothetical protein
MIKRHLFLLFLLFSLCLGMGYDVWGQTGSQAPPVSEIQPDTALEQKSPMGALLRSVAFPGWGQFYNKQYIKSLIVFGAETAFITAAAVDWSRMKKHERNFQNPNYPDRYWEFEQFEFYEDRRNMFLWITAGIVFLSMFDAYVDAHLYNFDREKVKDISISFLPAANGGEDMRIVFSFSF